MFVASCFMIHDAYYVDRQVYETQNAFSANATGTDYISRAFRNVAFISAQLPVNPAEKTMAENITDQTNQVLYNLAKTVTSTGGFMRNVLKINFFLLVSPDLTLGHCSRGDSLKHLHLLLPRGKPSRGDICRRANTTANRR